MLSKSSKKERSSSTFGFVTLTGTPNTTTIPAGLWDFNIWASSSGTVTNQTMLHLYVYKYDKDIIDSDNNRVEILLECKIEELNTFEEEAIQIYDALKCGFNTATEADIYQKGDKNGASVSTTSFASGIFWILPS